METKRISVLEIDRDRESVKREKAKRDLRKPSHYSGPHSHS